MSGHSKWKNIMHKKEKTDAQRAKVFTKIGKEISIAVKAGGPDPASNPKLKDLIAKAKSNNVPNDNIERVIKKAASGDTENYEELSYEGYGPSGIAVIVEATTDNRNRTGADLRHYFDKFGGNLGTTGCVSFMFEDKGVIVVEQSAKATEDAVMEAALNAGAMDFVAEEGAFEIYTDPADVAAIRDELAASGFEAVSAEVEKVPSTYVTLTNEDDIVKMNRLLEMLEDNEDVINVWHNWENFDEEIIKIRKKNKLKSMVIELVFCWENLFFYILLIFSFKLLHKLNQSTNAFNGHCVVDTCTHTAYCSVAL